MKKLVHMWKYPRMVSWFLLTTGLLLLVRLPFVKAAMIPYYLEFQPGIVVVPLAGVFWGPAGALGVLTASLAGDWLLGMWGPLSAFRAVGLFIYAYSANRLWDFSETHVGKRGGLTPHWGQTLRFLYVSWPGCCAAASWPALGADILRLYPFPYFVFLLLLNNLVFTTMLGPAFYRILARELVPHFGCWREVMKEHPSPVLSVRGAWLHVTGCAGACVAGILLGGSVYRMWPDQAFVIGTSTGSLLVALVLPLMLLQVVGLLLARRETRGSPFQSTLERTYS